LPDAFHAEFTGERVIPGRVEDNLFNEHFARYRFAARLPHTGGAALDAGCGAGYGAAELAQTRQPVLGIDVSPEAVEHARTHYASTAGLRFAQASCTAIPSGDAAFHLVTAFEVIEHLADWRQFLAEARRVLHPAGLFLVSTPNRLYYAESRQKAGPNPFHVHEFTEEEFRAELAAIFPHVKLLLQNHVEGISFSGADADGVTFETSGRPSDPSSAHFFLAICGLEPLPPIPGFVFIPDTGNVLQTRERHIDLLNGEIEKKNQWLETEKAERARMLEKVRSIEAELETQNRWAREANLEADRRARMVADLQAELEKSNQWAQERDAEAVERGRRIEELQTEVEQATAWARNASAEADQRGERIVELQVELEDRTAAMRAVQAEMAASAAGYEAAIEQWRRDKAAADQWALENQRQLDETRDTLSRQVNSLQDQLTKANQRLEMIAQSRWVRMGRAVGVGPEITRS